jgi:hypothetical protein
MKREATRRETETEMAMMWRLESELDGWGRRRSEMLAGKVARAVGEVGGGGEG